MVASTWRDRLHAYLGGVLRNIDAVPEAIGGVDDHVHLLIGLRATHRLSDVVRHVKTNSSRGVHDEIADTRLEWQERDTVRSPSAGPGASRCATTSPARRSITPGGHFRRNASSYFDERYLW